MAEEYPVVWADKCRTQQHSSFSLHQATQPLTDQLLCKNGEADNQLNNMDSGSTEYVLLMEGKLRRTKSNDMLSRSKKGIL